MGPGSVRIIPLLVIVAMMAFSVRLVDFSLGVSALSGAAFAEEADKAEKAPETMQEKKAPEKMAEKPPEAVMEKAQEKPSEKMPSSEAGSGGIKWRDAKDEGIGAANVRQGVLDDFAKRRKALDAREKSLVAREALVRAAQQELEQKYKELVNLRSQIETLLDRQSEEEAQRIASLVKIYEGMKPKDAARIFDTLDLDVLVSVMGRMSERKLSPVLAAMNPERARTVTIMLAEEKKLPDLN